MVSVTDYPKQHSGKNLLQESSDESVETHLRDIDDIFGINPRGSRKRKKTKKRKKDKTISERHI